MTMSRSETRYQRILRLIRDGQCGLLPLDLTLPCPKRGGPEQPQAEHPGKVGLGTCRGCEHQAGLHFHSRVCTHPNARQVAARWLAEAIRRSEEPGAASAITAPRSAAFPATAQAPASDPDLPKREEPAQLKMF
jgi:hypothetical protein